MIRAGLWFLAGMQTLLGLWTLVFPKSFYDSVPTVNLTPPYSEHLFRDFGAATLGVAFMLAMAAMFPRERRLVWTALIAYLFFAVPHLAFHVTHFEHFTTAQAVLLTIGLVAVTLLAVGLLVATIIEARGEADAKPALTVHSGDNAS